MVLTNGSAAVGIVTLDGGLQPRQTHIPKRAQQLANPGKAFWPQPVETSGSVAPLDQQTRPHEHMDVLRNSGPRGPETPGDVARRKLS